MAFMTDRKRAVGMGSAKTGTEHHWHMQISSYALIILVPLFMFTVGPVVGDPHDSVVAHFGRPFVAIITGLTLIVGFNHFRHGVQVLIEDYVHGAARKLLIITMICVSYGAMGVGLFALAKLAL